MRLRHIKAVLLSFSILLIISCFAAKDIRQENIEITVLFFNDIHGAMLPYVESEGGRSVEYGGIARISDLVKNIRSENEEKGRRTFVLFAGDLLQGSLMSTVFKGYPDILCFNEMGVDTMVIGNHEFDHGMNNFFKLKDNAGFPIISSNVYYRGKLISDPFALLPIKDGINLKVIGITIEDLLNVTDRSLLEGITTTCPIDAVKLYISEYTEKGPVMVLSHSDLIVEKEVARSFSGLSAIITGHDHILLDPVLFVDEVPLFQALQRGKYLGRADFSYNMNTNFTKLLNYNYYKITTGLPEDAVIISILEDFQRELEDNFSLPIGYTTVFLDAHTDRIRNQETNLGNFITDCVREYFDLDIVFINSGSIRASISEGEISIGDIYNSMPYENEVYTLNLTGEEVMEVLEISFNSNINYGGFLQQSGLRIEYDGIGFSEVFVISRDSRLDMNSEYSIAITDFMAKGGDNYAIFANKAFTKQYISFRDLVIKSILEKNAIGPVKDNRIKTGQNGAEVFYKEQAG